MKKLLYACLLLFLACTDPKKESQPIPSGGGGVLVVNEGNFMRGNASLSLIRNGQITEDVFFSANQRRLGDVAQSVTLLGKNAYVVVNNSGKIEVIDAQSFQSIATITGLRSPRYFLPITDDKAYVTDLYANAISIVSINKGKIIGSIPCAGWTEELILKGKEVFVTNRYRSHVYVIDSEKDQVNDSILVSRNANSIVEDRNGDLWVLCGGADGGIYRLNASERKVIQKYAIASNTDETPAELCINKTKDTLYYLYEGVYCLPISAQKLSDQPLISQRPNQTYYSLGIDPKNSQIYVGDAINYDQKGVVYRYRTDATPLDSFRVGVIPGEFVFLP
jgi:DNA-binding beta-propeller fold protein YncE